LAVIGTVALLLVAGGIFTHNIPFFHALFPSVPSSITEMILGLAIGLVTLGLVELVKKLIGKK
jgi:hypothetical protein